MLSLSVTSLWAIVSTSASKKLCNRNRAPGRAGSLFISASRILSRWSIITSIRGRRSEASRWRCTTRPFPRPAFRAGMTGHVMDTIQQRVKKRTNLQDREPSIIGLRLVERTNLVPFAVGREDSRQTRHVGAVMSQSRRIAVGERFCDAEADTTRAPAIIKADVK